MTLSSRLAFRIACASSATWLFLKSDLDYRDYVKTDESFYRPAEVDLLVGDATKARAQLGWRPEITFEELVREMVQSDLEETARVAHADLQAAAPMVFNTSAL